MIGGLCVGLKAGSSWKMKTGGQKSNIKIHPIRSDEVTTTREFHITDGGDLHITNFDPLSTTNINASAMNTQRSPLKIVTNAQY